MARRYQLRERAVKQAATRQRIVEAALDLHTELGPDRTTVSAIAERAGVQRHTFYAHFPDEQTLAMACSGLHLSQAPLPDAEPWDGEADAERRLRRALGELYAYYAAEERLLANVLRAVEVHPVSRAVVEERMGPWFRQAGAVLAEPLEDSEGARAAVRLALSFHAWRELARAGLGPDAAAEEMAALVAGRHARAAAAAQGTAR